MTSHAMAAKITISMAITPFCFCFDVADCEHVSLDDPGPYDITVAYTICNGEHFQAWTPYDVAVGDVDNMLMLAGLSARCTPWTTCTLGIWDRVTKGYKRNLFGLHLIF